MLGKGAYGKVWNGLNLKDGRLIAIKEMKLEDAAQSVRTPRLPGRLFARELTRHCQLDRGKKGSSKGMLSQAELMQEMIGTVTPEVALMQVRGAARRRAGGRASGAHLPAASGAPQHCEIPRIGGGLYHVHAVHIHGEGERSGRRRGGGGA